MENLKKLIGIGKVKVKHNDNYRVITLAFLLQMTDTELEELYIELTASTEKTKLFHSGSDTNGDQQLVIKVIEEIADIRNEVRAKENKRVELKARQHKLKMALANKEDEELLNMTPAEIRKDLAKLEESVTDNAL